VPDLMCRLDVTKLQRSKEFHSQPSLWLPRQCGLRLGFSGPVGVRGNGDGTVFLAWALEEAAGGRPLLFVAFPQETGKRGTNRAQKDVGPTEGSFTDHAADDAVAGISGRVARVVILSGVNEDCGPAWLKN
jgi:hypothetical protein